MQGFFKHRDEILWTKRGVLSLDGDRSEKMSPPAKPASSPLRDPAEKTLPAATTPGVPLAVRIAASRPIATQLKCLTL
jgi:hypothetical protein